MKTLQSNWKSWDKKTFCEYLSRTRDGKFAKYRERFEKLPGETIDVAGFANDYILMTFCGMNGNNQSFSRNNY